MALIAVPLGWKAHRASVQRRAVAAVTRVGGRVLYDWQVDPSQTFHGIGMLDRYNAEPPGPRWLRRWLGDEYFQEVAAVKVSGLSSEYLPGMPPPSPGGRPEWANLSDQQIIIKRREEFVTADRLACLDGLDQVRWIELGYMDLDRVGLERLARLTTVESLALDIKIDCDLIATMARLPRLRDLEMGGAGDDGGPMLPHLRTPRLIAKPSGPALDWIRQHRDLTDLTFRVAEIDDAVLAGLHGMTHLARLYAQNAPPVTDAGSANLTDLDELEEINFWGIKDVTDEGMAHLARLPRLEMVNFYDHENTTDGITDAGMTHLAKMSHLRTFCLSMAKRITDEGMAQLRHSHSLRSIGLPSATGITDAVWPTSRV